MKDNHVLGRYTAPAAPVQGEAPSLDRDYYTLVFEGDIGKFEGNPLNTETPFGKPIAAGRGHAFEDYDEQSQELLAAYQRIDELETALKEAVQALERVADLSDVARDALMSIEPFPAESGA